MAHARIDNTRQIKAPTGTKITCKSWLTEAPMRMLMNNLDGEVAENPQELVVYGGIGRAARDWDAFDHIVGSLKNLEEDETLIVQSGKNDRIPPEVIASYQAAFKDANSFSHRIIAEATHAMRDPAQQRLYATLLINWVEEVVRASRRSYR